MDNGMNDQGCTGRDRKGDLRDLLSRRHEESGTVTVSAHDNLLIAYGRMKLYDISQLPVLDSGGKVVGIIDEGDILLKVFHDDSRFKDPISSAMTSRLETIESRSEEHTSELQSLMRISYAVFCLKKKKLQNNIQITNIYPHRSLQQHYQQIY